MLQVGLVGTGPWAEMFHAPMLAEHPDIELAGVWSRRAVAAEALAVRYGTKPAASYEALLEQSEAVAFAVPPDIQAALAIQAAREGKHLLLDKPIAANLPAAEAVAGEVVKTAVASMIVLTHRFSPGTRELLRQLQGRRVAAVTCSLVSGSALDGELFATPWRQAEPHALLDLGPHALDLVVAVAGPVTHVAASTQLGAMSITLRHANGASSLVTLSATTPHANGLLECSTLTDVGRLDLTPLQREEAKVLRATVASEFVAAVSGPRQHPLDVQHGLALQHLISDVQAAITDGGRLESKADFPT